MEMQAGVGGAGGYQLMVGINVTGGSEPAEQRARGASRGVQGTAFREWKRGSSGSLGASIQRNEGKPQEHGPRGPEQEEPPAPGPPAPKEATGPPQGEATGPRRRWPQRGQEAALRVQRVQERAYGGGHSSQAFLRQNGVWGAGPRLRSKGEGFEKKYEGARAAGGARGSGGRRADRATYAARGSIPSPVLQSRPTLNFLSSGHV